MADDPRAENEPRIAELLRVNGELAVEIRDLALGRRTSPRRGQTAAARSVAKLQAERDALAVEIESTRDRLRAVENERDALLVNRDELELEVARLRSGLAGLLRRTRARLLRS
jgi:predicted  nucleic acid-binding Zn-ribbon protein